jgi:TonB family protein
MNDKNIKSSALFTLSGCLTGDALMLFVSGSLKGAALTKAQKHISECPLCTDAADGLRMWLKENKPDEAIASVSPDKPATDSSDLSGKQPVVKAHAIKSSSRPVNEFHVRTDVINERIRQRLHSHTTIKASENKRISYKPFVWLAAAASIVLLIGSFYVIWVQNQYDNQKLTKERADEMALLQSRSKYDTLAISLPVKKKVLAVKLKESKGTSNPDKNTVSGAIAEEQVYNQDELNITEPAIVTLSEPQQIEEVALMKEEAKLAQADKANSEPVAKNAVRAVKKSEIKANSEAVFTIVEEMPAFPGGEEARSKFIAENIVYPQQAAENGIQGTVYLSFIVNTKGTIDKIKILRGIGGGCDEEALRVMKLMPRWKPGRQNGKTVSVLYNMPVYFKLKD